MPKIHELQQKRATLIDEMLASTGGDDFNEAEYQTAEASVRKLDAQIDALQAAQTRAASLATPVPGQDGMTRTALPNAPKLYGTLKNFSDRVVGGQTVRAVDQAYAAGMWFKATIFDNGAAKNWCDNNGIGIQKAQGEGVDGAGGYLVPEELMANIIVLREKFGIFRQECQVIPMGSDTLNWPRRVGGLTASFVGENQAVTESQASWDNVNLTAKKLGALTRMSNEIAEDAVVSVADWLVGEIAYAFAAKEDDCGWNGDGTSAYGGIRGLTVLAVDGNHNAGKYTASGNTFSTLTTTDLVGLMGTLPQYATAGAKFYCSQMAFSVTFERLIASAGGNSVATLSDPVQYRYLGAPIVISQKLPAVLSSLSGKVMMAYGDLSKAAALGERRGVTIKRSDHRYFENDQIGILGTERFDINVHDCGDSTTAGPIVALIGS